MLKKILIILIVLIFVINFTFDFCLIKASNVNINNAYYNLLLYGDAKKLPDDGIQLTPLETWSSGSVYYNNQILTNYGFQIDLDFYAGGGRDDSYGGADGIVLAFSKTVGIGSQGEYLGFVTDGSYGVELDSYCENPGDPQGKHVGIIKDSVSNHIAYKLDDRVDDSKVHKLHVEYSNNKLDVYIDGEFVISSDNVNLPDKVYIGISAATGGGYNRHIINDFVFNGELSGDQIDRYLTSRDSVLGINEFEPIYRSVLSKCKSYALNLNKNKNIIIPGLIQTNQTKEGVGDACNNMIPQGVCVTNKYILVSAYDGANNEDIKPEYYHHKHNIVIYVLNKKTGKYIKTIILNDKGHAGAMAWNPDNNVIYIAGNDYKDDMGAVKYRVLMMDASKIDQSGNNDACYIQLNKNEKVDVDYHPTFLTYCGGYLYIGSYINGDGKNVKMIKCYPNCKRVSNSYETSMDNNTNGVAFKQGTDGNDIIYSSINNGRKYSSELKAYRTNINSCVTKYRDKIADYDIPCMSEDIDINGSLLYTCFESASNFYRYDWNSKGYNSAFPIDRVLVSYTQNNTFNSKNKSNNELNPSESGVVSEGECGELASYTFFENGTLSISGYGEINDYSSSNDAPWSEFADDITNITIGADINRIGKNTFSNLTNLKNVMFSKMLNDQKIFYIDEFAFKDCLNLNVISMPNVDYSINDKAFDGCDDLQVRSNANYVTDFCKSHSIDIHNHDYKYASTVSNTCLNDGYDIYKCSCGDEEMRNIKPASDNHSYKPTDTYGNLVLYVCENCGSKYEKEVTASEKQTQNKVTSYRNNKTTRFKKIKAKKKSLSVTWKRVSGVNGYQINYSLKKNFKKSKYINIRKNKTTSKIIKKLKRRKKYYLRIRTYINTPIGKCYSKWSKRKSKKTK